MFAIDIPYVPLEETVTAVEVQLITSQADKSVLSYDYLMEECVEVAMTGSPLSNPNEIDPIGMIRNALGNIGYAYIDSNAAAKMKVTVHEKPRKGTLTTWQAENGYTAFTYKSEPNYMGKDNSSFFVEFEGMRYKVIVNIEVLDIVDDDPTNCAERRYKLIKVNLPDSWLQEYNVSLSYIFANVENDARG